MLSPLLTSASIIWLCQHCSLFHSIAGCDCFQISNSTTKCTYDISDEIHHAKIINCPFPLQFSFDIDFCEFDKYLSLKMRICISQKSYLTSWSFSLLYPTGTYVCHQFYFTKRPKAIPVPSVQDTSTYWSELHYIYCVENISKPWPLDTAGSCGTLWYQVDILYRQNVALILFRLRTRVLSHFL